MGLFGGLGKALKSVDWDRVNTGLQTAGAIAQGDYGSAAQIQSVRRREDDARREAEAERQRAEAAMAALVRQGIPEADAQAIVASGAADTVLAGRFGQQNDSEFTRTLKAAGIDPASPLLAVGGVMVLSAAVLYFAARRSRRLEINYSTD